jgi:hypothetical protein
MMTLESALMDTSYDLELEKIKSKIKQLYVDLLSKTYKQAHPGATPEQLESFIEDNMMEFPEHESFDDDAEGLEKILDLLTHEEDLDKVSEKVYNNTNVEETKELSSKSKDSLRTPKTTPFDVPKGGLFNVKDKRSKVFTKSLKTPRGNIKRLVDDDPKVHTKPLQDIWDAEREKLLELVRKRNKENHVRFW